MRNIDKMYVATGFGWLIFSAGFGTWLGASGHFNFAESHAQFALYSRLAPRVGGVVSAEDHYLLWVTAYLSQDYETARDYLAKADPALREKALKTLDDPGLSRKQFQ